MALPNSKRIILSGFGLACLLVASIAPGANFWEEESGLRVIWIPYPGLERVHLHVLMRAGSSMDDPGRPGIAYLAAKAVANASTISLSSREIDAAKDRLGFRFRGWVDREFFHASVSLDPERLYAGIRLLFDILLNTDLNEESLTRSKEASRIHRSLRSHPEPSAEVAGFFFSDEAFAHPPFPREKFLEAIALEDIRRFHAAFYVPSNAVIAFAGPVEPERVAREIRASLFGFPGGTKATVPSPKLRTGGLVTLAFHETSPGRSKVTVGILGPGAGTEGWEGWINRAYSLEDRLREAILSDGIKIPDARWLSASYLAGSRMLFEATIEAESSQTQTVTEVMKREVQLVFSSSGRKTEEAKPRPGIQSKALAVTDVLMRFCLDQAYGHPAEKSDHWVKAAESADRRSWATVLVPEGE